MTAGEIRKLVATRRLRYHFVVRWSHLDPDTGRASYPTRLVQVPVHCVDGLLGDLPDDTHVSAELNEKDLVIGL